jgi:ferric-dicitrate binding protein FerR (iron transport regulator)
MGYNTVATPRGGMYKVVLPDGTAVWLNAASSIRFPTTFTGPVREVDMSGEAYFQVKHSITTPFRVRARGRVIEDIGTQFDVEAYGDEPVMRTTLEEGAVRVGNTVLHKAGDQAAMDMNTGNTTLERQVDLERVLGWKNGMFIFDRADLATVLSVLSRWYDVDVVYKTNKDTINLFSGQLSREVKVNVNLRILAETGYNLQVSGKTIEVLPETK